MATADVRSALLESGVLGATARQIATRLGTPTERVSAELARLRGCGDIRRIGRGLWVLRDYHDLGFEEDFVRPEEFVERFAREDGVTLGRYSGPITFRSNDRLPIHRWWPYVQGYSAEFVADLLAAQPLGRGAAVLDPFSGSGTTLVEGRRNGWRAIGFELLAPAVLAARVKTDFEVDPAALRRSATSLIARAGRARVSPVPFLRETRRQFAPRALAELRRLRSVLPRSAPGVADALRLAFGATLIPSSRLRRSPCLGYEPRPTERPRPFVRIADVVEQMAGDLEALGASRPRWGPPATVREGDARAIDLPEGSIDFAVTSPPYVNGLDYVMNYKLDLAWLGYASSYRDLSALRHREVACDNLPRSSTAGYLDPSAAPDPWLRELLPRIRDHVVRKGTYRRDDMHGIVLRYFADLEAVMRGVYRVLRPGGRFVLVVGDSLLAGTYVPGDLLTARLGDRLGFAIESVQVARARRSGQRRHFLLRESIVTLRRPDGGSR